MKCQLCNSEINEKDSHNGYPLVEGRVCNDCNWKVIRERLRKSKEKVASEDVAVVGGGGPINTTDPMADFEKYAKQFEETFVLGNTPTRKEVAENRTKIVNGEIAGEVISEDKSDKNDKIKPINSATESNEYLTPNSDRLIEMVKDKLISALSLAEDLVAWLPDDEIGRFCRSNGYFIEEVTSDDD